MVGVYCRPPGNPFPRLGSSPARSRCVHGSAAPVSDLGTVRSARTLSTGSRHHLIVFRGGGPPAGRRAAGRVGVDRRPWCLRAGPGVRLGGRGVHLPGRDPGGWADVPRSGLSAAANRTISSCRRPRGRSCAAVVRSSPLLSKIAGRADDKHRMCGLRGRWAHIVERVSIGRDHVPVGGTRVHPAGTLPDMREHRAPGWRHPPRQSPTAGRSPPGQAHGNRSRDHRRSRMSRRSRQNPPHLSKIRDAGATDPCTHRDPGRRRPPAGERGCPEGG